MSRQCQCGAVLPVDAPYRKCDSCFAAQAARRQSRRVELTGQVSVSAQTYERLRAYAQRTGQTIAAVVERLVADVGVRS